MQLREVVNSKPVIYQAVDAEIRASGDGTRYSFVAATERAVDTPFGPEVLRMSGVRLQRYRRNPVVLDSHNRSEAGAVVGRADMKRVDNELHAEITFANTARAAEIRQLVDEGMLRAVSVGFVPNPARIQTLRAGESDGDLQGPARVIREWELIELSMVPVPADADALARSHYFGAERQRDAMQYPDPAPAAEATPAPATKQELPEEVEARRLKAKAEARALAEGEIRRLGEIAKCDDVAAQLILDGATVETARALFKAEIAKRSQPVGTPEPAQPAPEAPADLTKPEALTVLRALGADVEVR